MTTRAWIVGASGLLGSAVSRAIHDRADWIQVEALAPDWSDADSVVALTAATAARLIREADGAGDGWAIVHVGGSGATSSPQSVFDRDLDLLGRMLDTVASEIARAGAQAAPGSFFYASSAGGVYGGSSNPPFDESTEPCPLGAYGRFKLAAEELVTDFSRSTGVSAMIGRITNLYGPGQRLDKMQGLISHLVLAEFNRTPVHVFVPLETTRDYLYVDDAARLILANLDRLAASDDRVVVKILGSGQETTISSLIGHIRAIRKVPGRIRLGTTPSSAQQAVDLRLRSRVWTDLDSAEKTPLPAGIHATVLSILRSLQ